MSIIDKTRAELDAEALAKKLEKHVMMEANAILPHVANCSPHLEPEAVVERAIAITRAMHKRLIASGCDLVEGQSPIPIIGGPNGTMPAQLRSMLGLG